MLPVYWAEKVCAVHANSSHVLARGGEYSFTTMIKDTDGLNTTKKSCEARFYQKF